MQRYAFAFITSSNGTNRTFVSLMYAHCRFGLWWWCDGFSSDEEVGGGGVEDEEVESSVEGREELGVDGGRAVYAT